MGKQLFPLTMSQLMTLLLGPMHLSRLRMAGYHCRYKYGHRQLNVIAKRLDSQGGAPDVRTAR